MIPWSVVVLCVIGSVVTVTEPISKLTAEVSKTWELPKIARVSIPFAALSRIKFAPPPMERLTGLVTDPIDPVWVTSPEVSEIRIEFPVTVEIAKPPAVLL